MGPETGVVVLEVVTAGPAARADIQPGDVIDSVEGDPVRSVEDFLAEIRRRNPGDRIDTGFVRDSSRRNVKVVLVERPTS